MFEYEQNLISEFLKNRRSVLAVNLQEPGPDEDRLKEIIQIGIRVPDHSRCGPWRIQIIRKNAQAKLGDFYALQFKKNNLAATREQVEYWRLRPQLAPILLVVTCYPNKEKIQKVPLLEQLLSCGALCQNLLNGAHACGFSAQWITEWPAYDPKIRKALGHSDDIEVCGFIFIGSAKEKPSERKRIGINDVVTEWDGSMVKN